METWEEFRERGKSQLREEGNLSGWLDEAKPYYRMVNESWIDYARDLNKLGQKILHATEHVTSEKSVVDAISFAYRLFLRSMGGFQAGMLLAERGLTKEADILTRSIYENGFWIGYFVADSQTACDTFMQDELASRFGRLKAYRSAAVSQEGEGSDMVRAADEVIRKALRGKQADISKIAKVAGFSAEYLRYKLFSAGAAHASVNSVYYFVKLDEQKRYSGHSYGPSAKGISPSVWSLCDALHLNLVTFEGLVKGTGHQAEVEAMLNRFLLMGEPKPDIDIGEED